MDIKRKISVLLTLITATYGIAVAGFDFSSAQTANDTRLLDISASLFNSEDKEVPNGEYDVRFALYTVDREKMDPYPSNADAGHKVWEETQKIKIYDGILTAYLGTATSFPDSVNFEGAAYYLGIRIGQDSEAVPRKKIASVPGAVNSQFLRGATTGTKEGNIPIIGKSDQIDIDLLPTGTSGKKLVLANNPWFDDIHTQNTDTGTDSLTFNIGDGSAISSNDFDITVSSASSSPALRYSGSTVRWQFSNDGTTYSNIPLSSDIHNPATLAGAYDYLTISDQAITLAQIDLTTDITGILPPANGGTGVANETNNTITFTGNYTLGLTLTDNTSVTLPTSGTLAATSQIVTDHGDLTGLSDDDHDIYALLAGRTSGQTLIGGTVADTTLTIQGNSTTGNTATSANLVFKVGDSGGTTAMTILNNGNVGIGTASPNEQLEITGNFRLPTSTDTTGIIFSGADRFIHNYGTNNFFAGVNAGNLTMTGTGANTAVGAEALYSNTDGYQNTVLGYQAGYSNTGGDTNVFIGYQAGYSNTIRWDNTAVGVQALKYNTAEDNSAFGYRALYYNTTGHENSGISHYALKNNTTGNHNTAIGYDTLYYNTTGSNNTATGYDTLYKNTTGSNNTADGYYALYSTRPTSATITVFADNGVGGTTVTSAGHGLSESTEIAIRVTTNYNGTWTIFNVATDTFDIATAFVADDATGWWGIDAEGRNNTALGYYAGRSNITGSNNLFLGYNAGYTGTSADLTNATCIGYECQVTASNSLILGGTGANAVNVGIGTTSPSYKLEVADGGTIAAVASDTSALKLYSNDTNSYVETYNNFLYLQTPRNSDDIIFTPNNSEAMRIDATNGNVGIGTASPASKLQIEGTATYPAMLLEVKDTSASLPGRIKLNSMNTGTGHTGEIWFMGLDSLNNETGYAAITSGITDRTDGSEDGDIDFWTRYNGTWAERMTFTSAGNLGIGTTTPGNFKLNVNGEIATYGSGGYVYTHYDSINSDYGSDVDNAWLWLNYVGYQDGTTRFRDTVIGNGKQTAIVFVDGSAGNVGIGTTSPGNKLHIVETSSGAEKTILKLDNQGTAVNTAVGLQFNGLDGGGFPNGYGKIVAKMTDNTSGLHDTDLTFSNALNGNWNTVMTMQSSGNVGIGTASPGGLLALKGTLSSALTGTVSVTAATAAVTGVGTLFTTELAVGDSIKIGSEVFTVSVITDNLNLTLDSNHVAGASGVTAYRDPTLFAIDNGDAVNKLTVTRSGNVGIGTTGPDRKLDILDASNPQLRLTYTNESVYTDFQTNSSGNLIVNPTGDNVTFGATGNAISLIPAENNTAGYQVGTSSYRWKTGYFVDGIVTGSSSTTYAESGITSTYAGEFTFTAAANQDIKLLTSGTGKVVIPGKLQIQNNEIEIAQLSSPSSTTEGAIYYDTDDDNLYVYANGGWVDLTVQGGGVSDHGALTGLLDDDHTQYALLAGRASGQILKGGAAANETLTLQGNAASSGNTATNANLIFKVGDSGGTTAMTILNNGNVGIGTNDPGSYKLRVYGDVFLGGDTAPPTSFGTNGVVTSNPTVNADYIHSIAIDSNYIYAAGVVYTGTETYWRIEKRDKTTGALVTAFDSDGIVESNPSGTFAVLNSIAVDANYIYAAGTDDISPSNGEWRIEKRDIVTGALVAAFDTDGVVNSNPSNTYSEQLNSIAIDANYIYLGGYDIGSNVDAQWRIEKRDITTGALVTAFDSDGVILFDTVGSDIVKSIAVDANYIYAAGTDDSPSNGEWRIEKRDIVTGALVAAFDGNGVVNVDPTSSGSDDANSITIDSNYLYVGGMQFDYNWRIEKRDITTGALVTAFGTDGVIKQGYGQTNMALSTYDKSLAVDSTYLYAVGNKVISSVRKPYIEKRNKTSGLLVESFDGDGVVISEGASNDAYAFSVAIDSSYLYTEGYDVPASTDARWRIEKRDINTGGLMAVSSGLYVNSTNGRIGIGTTNPLYNLDVEGYVQAGGYYTGDIIFQKNGVDLWKMYEDEEDGLRTQNLLTGQDILTITNTGNVGIGTTNPGGGTGSSVLTLANSSVAPTALANTTHLYSSAGEGYWMDAAGNAALQTPHDLETGKWIFSSTNVNTDRTLRVEMEDLTKYLDAILGGGYVFENGEAVYQGENILAGIDARLSEQGTIVSDLTFKTNENIDSLEELQESIDKELVKISNSQFLISNEIQNQKIQITNYGLQIADLNSQISNYQLRITSIEELQAKLQTQIDELKKLANAELNLAQMEANKTDIDYLKLLLGINRAENPEDVSLLGKLTAGEVVAGVFTIKITDEESKTIGKNIIPAGETSFVVKTKAVSPDSKIFITISQADKAVPIKAGDIKEGESFEVKINDPAASEIEFNWWVVEEK